MQRRSGFSLPPEWYTQEFGRDNTVEGVWRGREYAPIIFMLQHQGHGHLRSLSVLHVEDDAITQLDLASLLGGRVGRLTTVGDGCKAMELCLKEQPDIVITDIRLPRLSGLELVEIIRAEETDTQVIVTSAYNDADYLLKAIELGVNRYLLKPFEPAKVLEALDKAAESLVMRRQAEESTRLTHILLDINPTFMVSVDRGRVDYVNRPFLSYLGFGSLSEFNDAGADVSGFIEEVSGFQDKTRKRQWLSIIQGTRGEPVIVRLRGARQEEPRAFLAWANRLPGPDRHVISLTDVTRLEEEKRRLVYKASTDYLTGLLNRRKLIEHLTEEIKRAERYGTPLSLIMFDIDDFKRINDTHGHAAGDQVLVGLARLLTGSVRIHDKIARWGGEEFLLVVPGCDLDRCAAAAEKLRRLIAAHDFDGIQVTCSFGVVAYQAGEDQDHFLGRADKALYEAKNSSKNTVICG